MAKTAFVESAGEICSNTDVQDIALKPKSQTVWRTIQRMAADTGTTKATLIDFGAKKGSAIIWFAGQIQSANYQVVAFSDGVRIPGDWAPFIRVRGGTSGQPLTLYIYGYYSDEGP